MSKSCALPKKAFPVNFKVRSVVHALELAKGLIRPFKHWTVNVLATESTGDTVYELTPKSPKAQAFCALGALRRVNTKYGVTAEGFLKDAAVIVSKTPPGFGNPIFTVNDDAGRTVAAHRKVLRMFTVAIKLAKKAAGKK